MLRILDDNEPPTSSISSEHGGANLDRSLTDRPSNEDAQQGETGLIPMIKLASVVGSFLAANSRSQPGSLNLHPIPIDSVQTFVLPDDLSVDSKDLSTVGTHGQAVQASSSGTLFVGNGGDFEEIMVDLTATARRSHVSSAKGRTGPLSEESRAQMKLLKEIGACWHCRFTKKEVSRGNLFDSDTNDHSAT